MEKAFADKATVILCRYRLLLLVLGKTVVTFLLEREMGVIQNKRSRQ